mgnify:CR=1 FL=1
MVRVNKFIPSRLEITISEKIVRFFLSKLLLLPLSCNVLATIFLPRPFRRLNPRKLFISFSREMFETFFFPFEFQIFYLSF